MSHSTAVGDQLLVRSHVARDLLQNAALFKTDKLVVWEYVSNGLQYVDPGSNPVVRVLLDSKKHRINISDNGRGMDWQGLQNFFVMHGENLDRKLGHPGRGRFGTGKCAAFGIAESLTITTARNGLRSKVQLTRTAIATMKSEAEIPVAILEREVATAQPNGTLIEIEGIHLKSLDQSGTIRYIERHLARWPKGSRVLVNNHECEFTEPPTTSELQFSADGAFRDALGHVTLIVKVAKAPLDDDLRGIAIFSNGVWHETTLAGSEGREMSQYIFGEIDIPRLEEDNSPIPPFDLSRSMRLNPANALVQSLYSFIGRAVEDVRRGLVQGERERRISEEAKRLRQQASEIARMINEDFEEFRRRVLRTRAQALGGADSFLVVPGASQDDADGFATGDEVPAAFLRDEKEREHNGSAQEPAVPQARPKSPPEPMDGDLRGRSAAGANQGRRRSSGGFDVRFDRLGGEAHRAVYVRQERAIFINLDHPQLAAVLRNTSIEDPVFIRLAHEVAFAEYAVALASELAANDEYLDPSDPIVDIRESLNRLARKAALMYAMQLD